MRYLIILLLFATTTIAQNKEITIISWNIQHFGKTKNAEEIEKIAEIVKHADIIAIQEVVTTFQGVQAVNRLTEALEKKGESWDYLISEKTNSPSRMTECYAIVWKNKHIKIKKGHEGSLVKELDKMVDREPFLVQFYVADTSFFVMNYHAKPHKRNPRPEVKELLAYVQKNYKNKKFILAGDFNLSQSEEVFKNFKLAGFKPVNIDQKTTLKLICKNASYLNYPIDNIFYTPKINATSTKIIDFVKHCDNLTASRRLSDHLPVELKFRL
ncbi:endonuclease/exonuclease/phosphatase family protein [Kordia algicida OT-1]|uniref:Endonuclease/exonuclease/phosphatase n=1 Tax=Kordia algicida OT-1 TaxID=391587 RepID=A9DNF0_9FLAO|nr:endonuclease/exonuclease/phosphatase family protein [Kordia algicida]EDP97175.1 Endonuclease/exonuclease/phosphatase [Kordia algicida OT-1]